MEFRSQRQAASQDWLAILVLDPDHDGMILPVDLDLTKIVVLREVICLVVHLDLLGDLKRILGRRIGRVVDVVGGLTIGERKRPVESRGRN